MRPCQSINTATFLSLYLCSIGYTPQRRRRFQGLPQIVNSERSQTERAPQGGGGGGCNDIQEVVELAFFDDDDDRQVMSKVN
jgi:hypothetical protein